MAEINLSTLEEVEITLNGTKRKGTFTVTEISQSETIISLRLEDTMALRERNSMKGW